MRERVVTEQRRSYLEVEGLFVESRVEVGQEVKRLFAGRLVVRLQVVRDLGCLDHALVVGSILLQKLLVERAHRRLGGQDSLQLRVDHAQHVLVQRRLELVDCQHNTANVEPDEKTASAGT